MGDTFRLRILASDRTFFDGDCRSLVIPTVDGTREILAHHSNMIAALVPGTLKGRFYNDPPRIAAVSEGLIKVENNDVLVLVETIELPEEIDANRAKRAEAHSREILLQKKSYVEYKTAQATLARALTRLKVRSSYNHR